MFPPFVGMWILAWLALELAAFIAVAHVAGFGGALLIGLASSLIGAILLRQAGAGAIDRLRSAFDGAPAGRPSAMLDGWIKAFGAILLILPGFISDLAGLALVAPSVRQALARRFGGAAATGRPPRHRRPSTIDLDPGEWSSIERNTETARQ